MEKMQKGKKNNNKLYKYMNKTEKNLSYKKKLNKKFCILFHFCFSIFITHFCKINESIPGVAGLLKKLHLIIDEKTNVLENRF